MSTAAVIWGELLWDRFPPERGGDQLGGAPANLAWHLGQAGGWPQLVTRVGDDDDGRRALAKLDEVVDLSLVQIDPERATGEVTVELVGAEPRYTLHAGRAWERIAYNDMIEAAIEEAGVFAYGTLAQRTPEGFAAWRRAAAAAGGTATLFYDANLRPNDRASHVIGEALDHADVIKLNDREVGQLRTLFGWPDPIAAINRVRPRVIVVTHGADGSTIHPLDGPAIEIAATPAAPGGDNVGCGDAYVALLIFGMTSGWDLAASARIASRWAAAVAEVRGATPRFDDARIEALLEAP